MLPVFSVTVIFSLDERMIERERDGGYDYILHIISMVTSIAGHTRTVKAKEDAIHIVQCIKNVHTRSCYSCV